MCPFVYLMSSYLFNDCRFTSLVDFSETDAFFMWDIQSLPHGHDSVSESCSSVFKIVKFLSKLKNSTHMAASTDGQIYGQTERQTERQKDIR